jgi:acyl-CoA thioesterase
MFMFDNRSLESLPSVEDLDKQLIKTSAVNLYSVRIFGGGLLTFHVISDSLVL